MAGSTRRSQLTNPKGKGDRNGPEGLAAPVVSSSSRRSLAGGPASVTAEHAEFVDDEPPMTPGGPEEQDADVTFDKPQLSSTDSPSARARDSAQSSKDTPRDDDLQDRSRDVSGGFSRNLTVYNRRETRRKRNREEHDANEDVVTGSAASVSPAGPPAPKRARDQRASRSAGTSTEEESIHSRSRLQPPQPKSKAAGRDRASDRPQSPRAETSKPAKVNMTGWAYVEEDALPERRHFLEQLDELAESTTDSSGRRRSGRVKAEARPASAPLPPAAVLAKREGSMSKDPSAGSKETVATGTGTGTGKQPRAAVQKVVKLESPPAEEKRSAKVVKQESPPAEEKLPAARPMEHDTESTEDEAAQGDEIATLGRRESKQAGDVGEDQQAAKVKQEPEAADRKDEAAAEPQSEVGQVSRTSVVGQAPSPPASTIPAEVQGATAAAPTATNPAAPASAESSPLSSPSSESGIFGSESSDEDDEDDEDEEEEDSLSPSSPPPPKRSLKDEDATDHQRAKKSKTDPDSKKLKDKKRDGVTSEEKHLRITVKSKGKKRQTPDDESEEESDDYEYDDLMLQDELEEELPRMEDFASKDEFVADVDVPKLSKSLRRKKHKHRELDADTTEERRPPKEHLVVKLGIGKHKNKDKVEGKERVEGRDKGDKGNGKVVEAPKKMFSAHAKPDEHKDKRVKVERASDVDSRLPSSTTKSISADKFMDSPASSSAAKIDTSLFGDVKTTPVQSQKKLVQKPKEQLSAKAAEAAGAARIKAAQEAAAAQRAAQAKQQAAGPRISSGSSKVGADVLAGLYGSRTAPLSGRASGNGTPRPGQKPGQKSSAASTPTHKSQAHGQMHKETPPGARGEHVTAEYMAQLRIKEREERKRAKGFDLLRPADAITEAERMIYEESRSDPRLAIKYWQFGVGAGLWCKGGAMDPPGNNFKYGHRDDEDDEASGSRGEGGSGQTSSFH